MGIHLFPAEGATAFGHSFSLAWVPGPVPNLCSAASERKPSVAQVSEIAKFFSILAQSKPVRQSRNLRAKKRG